MSGSNLRGFLLSGVAGLSFCALFLAGCGASSTSSATTLSAASANATCVAMANQNRSSSVSGTVKSISSTEVVLTNTKGSTVDVHLSSNTRYTQDEQLARTALSAGKSVMLRVQQGSGNVYTALSITVRSTTGTGTNTGAFGSGGGTGGNGGNGGNGGQRSGCGTRPQGTPGANRGGNRGGASTGNINGASLVGQVSGLNGNTLTVQDSSGNDYSITLTATTKITQTNSVTASTLKTGESVTVTGTSESDGSIDARSVTATLAS